MGATTRPVSPEAQRTTAQNLKPHARRRTATATVRDGTEAGLFLTVNSIGPGGLVSKPETHTHRLSWYVGSRLRGNDKQEPPWETAAFHDMQSGRKFAAALFIPMGWAVVFRDS